MFIKSRDGQNIYCEVFGKEDASETLVFLNGLTQSTMAWAFLTPAFKPRYKIILLDFIFQGQSDKSGEWRNFDTHAKDVVTVLDHLNVNKIILVGISYGSLVAQHFALLFPERLSKLVLLSTFAHKTPYYEAVELSWWRALEQGGYNLMLDIMLPTVLSEGYFKNPVVPIASLKSARKGINESSGPIFKLMRATKERKDFRQELKKIKCPTLIVQGEKDMLFPPHMAEEVQQNITGSKLEIIKGAGHTLNLEHVPEVVRAISSFLDQESAK
jgi:3-oxoadipate enol-lactonase